MTFHPFFFLLLVPVLRSLTSSTYDHEDLIQQKLTVTLSGEQIANEFQLINQEKIATNPTRQLNTVQIYNFTGISPLIIRNNDLVKVSFTSTFPAKGDWIAAYSTEVNYKKTVPIKFGLCITDPFYQRTGSGHLFFNFTNIRGDIVFKYFVGSLHDATLVAESSEVLQFENINEPLRPRIVPVGTSDPDTFKLLWSSAISTNPMVKWGTTSGVYTSNVYAETQRIDRSQLCGAPANTTGWRDLGMIHTAFLKGMIALANEKIYYTFGDANTNDFSREYVFHVPPVRGSQPKSRPTRVILYDDLGRGSSDDSFTWNEYGRPSYYTAMAVGAEVNAGEVDAVYHGGDISYATGYMAVWDHFLNMISPIASGVLYLSTVGNHESDWPHSDSFYHGTDSGGECGILTTSLLPLPAPATVTKPWWSYDIGIIHFVGMSTEHDFRVGSEQYAWLDADLGAVDRKVTPWVIFGGHRPMYINSGYSNSKTGSSGKDTDNDDDKDMERATGDIEVMNMLIKHVEPLLMKHQVNVAFYGHNHVVQRHSAVYQKNVYQRSSPIVNDKGEIINVFRDPSATVHMVVGTGGAAFTVNAVEPPPEWNERYFYKWGYARVTAVNATYLTWDWVESSSGVVWDRMAIQQSDNWADKPKWINAKPLITKQLNTASSSSWSDWNQGTFLHGYTLAGYTAFFVGGVGMASLVVYILMEIFYVYFRSSQSSSSPSSSLSSFYPYSRLPTPATQTIQVTTDISVPGGPSSSVPEDDNEIL